MSDPVEESVARLASPSAFEASGAEASLRTHREPARVSAALVARLADASWPEGARRRAVRLLGDLPGEAARVALLAAARAPEKTVRASAALALGRHLEVHGDLDPDGPWEARDALLSLLQDPARDVRAAACAALEHARPGPRGLVAVARALGEVAARTRAERPDLDARALAPWVHQEQALLLRALDPWAEDPALADALRPLLPELVAIAGDPAAEDPDARLDAASRAAALLGRAGEPSAVAGLAAVLDDPTPRNGAVLDAVAFALGELGGPAAIAALERELARPRLWSFEAAGYPETVRAALLRARGPSR